MQRDLEKIITSFIFVFFVIHASHAVSQIFNPTSDSLHRVVDGSTEWGDYDSDGDLDILIAGSGSLKIFRNDNFGFFEVADLQYINSNHTKWFDYDLDGDLDIFMTGLGGDNVPATEIFRYLGNDNFVSVGINLPQEYLNGAAIGDFDNDGDPDILFAGWRNAAPLNLLLRNDPASQAGDKIFTAVPTNLPDFIDTFIETFDFDRDGDLDFALTGSDGGENEVLKVFRNDGMSIAQEWQFTEMNTSMAPIGGFQAAIKTADYDSDGNVDIIVSGQNDTSFTMELKLYRNYGTGMGNVWDFFDSGVVFTGLTGISDGDLECGDYDNDGDLDLIITGQDPSFGNRTLLYQNEGNNTFTDIQDTNLIFLHYSTATWGDFDNDNDLDLLLSGDSSSIFPAIPITTLFRNDGGFIPNLPPTIPAGLSSQTVNDTVRLSWLASTDNSTPPAGLSYNLQITSQQDNQLLLSPLSDIQTGYRYVPQSGNAGNKQFWYLNNPTPGQYSWAIQAIDNSFAGSPFSIENSFIIKGSRFIESGINLPMVTTGDVDWIDYDNDTDLDLFISGNFFSGNLSQLYKNEGFDPDSGWIFRGVNTGIQDVSESSTSWGDFDNDGDVDLLLLGFIPSSESAFTELYRNDGSDVFTPQLNAIASQVYVGSAVWGDVDNDGDLDFILSGYSTFPGGDLTYLYLNEGSDSASGWKFTQMNTGIPPSEHTTSDWGDFDNDGDLDLIFSGWSLEVGQTEFAAVYRNEGQLDDSTWNFTDMSAGLPPVADGTTQWGDYDGDGDLDILIVNGFDGLTRISRIYRNEGEISGNWQFSEIDANLPDLQYGKAAWGDYDNDGDLDIAMTGELVNFASAFSGIYRNDGLDIFTLDTTVTITDAIFSSLAWGDYDNDGDLDLVIIGSTPAASSVILQNVGGFSPNQPPQPPLGLNVETFLDSVIVSWLPSQDDSTFDAGICYNLRIGTSPGGEDIVSPMSNDTGYRKVLNFGNANHNLSRTIKKLRTGTYYWAVQAIDHSFAGSQFSPEGMFDIREPYYQELAINLPGLSGGDLEWCDYDNDNDLDLFISGDSDSGAVVSLYNNGGFSPVTGWLFNEIQGVFPNLSSAASSWGDFDNDGDIDLVLQGHDGIDFQIELYRNEGNNIFIPENVNNLSRLAGGDLAWGDFDNDGDLDLIQAGHIDLVNIGNCYRNDGIDSSGIWQFTPMNADVRGFSSGCYDLGDFDNDRDLDILWTGFYAGAFATGVIRNDGVLDDTSWSFVEIVQFSGSGKARWGDYDSDGDLDILLAGNAPQGPKFSIYRNDGAIVGGGWLFSEIIIGAGNIQGNDACWGDYDSDGDLDILISGSSESSLMPVTNLFRNDQNDIFTRDIFGQFTPASSGRVSFVDFDNDGDLDIGLSGLASMLGVDYRILKIYQNEGGFTPNLPPASPTGLTTQTFVDSVIVSWQGVTDDLTPSTGLAYNLRMGRSPAAQDIMTPMSDLLNGYRKIVGLGNTNQNLNWTIKKLTPGNYYWSVQAIDNSFFGSAFSAETSFTIGIPPTIVHVPTDTQRVDSAVAVSALINTSSILVEANLNYKQGGSVNYLKIPMQIAGNQYIGEIPPEAVTSRGLTYFIEAVDENGLISYTDTFSIRIKLEGNGITAVEPQPAGSSQNSYRLISVPLDLENKILPAILEDDLGTYDKTKWRLFEPLAGGGFQEHPNVSPAMPGKAYWLIVAQENIFIDTGPGKTMNTVTPFSYQLYPGWNYFGIPFNFSVPMSAITLANNQDVDVRIYEGSWNVLSDSLHPFKGYAVYSEEATELYINPNLADSSGRNGRYRPKSTADYNWFIKISAYNQEATDLYNFVGVTAQASPQWDVYDLPEAPPMGDFISVAFPHPEWKRKCGDFATDIRGDFATGYKWEFSVRSNIGHQTMLILEKSENFPEDKYSCLIDVHSGTSLQIENSSLYTFSYSDNQSTRNFILLVGDSEFVQENQKSDRFLPTSFELFPNFPNPFNPTTKIRYAVPPPHNSGEPHHVQINIFNIGGQKVATLVDERKTAGYHEVNFDASRLASGVYICQFRSAGFMESRKMIFLR